jgi:hypothetical protein
MKFLTTFARFWYDFIVGDDWRLAVGTVAAITVVTVAANRDINVWWALLLMVSALLAVSVNAAARKPVRQHTDPLSDSRSPLGEPCRTPSRR